MGVFLEGMNTFVASIFLGIDEFGEQPTFYEQWQCPIDRWARHQISVSAHLDQGGLLFESALDSQKLGLECPTAFASDGVRNF